MKTLIFTHYLRRSMKEPLNLLIITGLPTALIFILSLVFNNLLDDGVNVLIGGYNIINSTVAIMFMVMFQFFGGNVLLDYLHGDFRGDRRWRMFAMPARTNDYILGSLGACFLFCVIQGAFVICFSAIFLNAYWGNPWVLIATLVACSALAQLIWMLLFFLIPKKGTVEAAGQIVTWGLMFLSGGWFTFNPEEGFAQTAGITNYLNPISLARNAISNSGSLEVNGFTVMGGDMNNSLMSLGILFGQVALLAVIVLALGKVKGFSPGKSKIAQTASSVPDKKLSAAAKPKPKIEDIADISKQQDLNLIEPTIRGGQFTIYKYALIRAFRNPLSLIFNAVLPFVVLATSGLWIENEAGMMGFSLIGVSIMYGAFIAARGILNDRLDGTIARIFTTPTTASKYLSQNLMAAMTPQLFLILAVGVVGSILNRWDAALTPRLLLLYFVFAVTSVAFSFAWSCLFKEKESSYAVFSVLMSLVSMLGGLFMPLTFMPESLRVIGAFFPAYWASNSLLYLQDIPDIVIGNYWTSLGVIAAFGVVYMIFGTKRKVY